MSISGTTKLIAHLGYPTESFKAPLIYNPYFAARSIDAVVVPMGCKSEEFAQFLSGLTRLSNFLGGLITMPHKVAVVDLLDEASTTVKVAGSCNAIRVNADGGTTGDMFDGEGFVRGVERKGRTLKGARVLVIGCGGVGSAIAASLAKSGVGQLGIREIKSPVKTALAKRLALHFPHLSLSLDAASDDTWDVIVNATPLGMNPGDPLPIDLADVPSSTLVGEVVLSNKITPFLHHARQRGCDIQVGLDMLFEQIPAYLEFFDLPTSTPDELRATALL
ncbi:MAG: shikimate dehydrogenase family protein [Hyphomicrobiaceae bacterium]